MKHTSKTVDAGKKKTRKLQEQKFVSIRFYLFIFHLIQFIKQYCLPARLARYICKKPHRRLKRIVASETNYLPRCVTVDKAPARGIISTKLNIWHSYILFPARLSHPATSRATKGTASRQSFNLCNFIF